MKRIYRSTDDKMIGGVAAGIAHYLELDVALIRLLWVLAVFLGGAGIAAYLVAWIIIPEEPYSGAISRGIAGGNIHENKTPSGELDEYAGDEEDFSGGEAGNASAGSCSPGNDRTNQVFGVLLVVLGIAFLIRETLNLDIFRYMWPGLLILLGIFILFNNDRRGSS